MCKEQVYFLNIKLTAAAQQDVLSQPVRRERSKYDAPERSKAILSSAGSLTK